MKNVLLIFSLLLTGCLAGRTADFSFQSGLGYDYFSQEYFLDSAANTSDSLFTAFALQNTYINDVKTYLSGSYAPDNGKTLFLYSKIEFSKDYNRFKTGMDITTKFRKSRLLVTTEVDYRNKANDAAEGDSFLFGYYRTRLITPLSSNLSLSTQIKGEFLYFDSTNTYNYNYYRLGGKIGLERKFGLFSFGDIHLTYLTRQVEDSTSLTYDNIGVESRFSLFYNSGDLDLYSRWEQKDYNRIDETADYSRLEIFGQNRFRHSSVLFTRQKLNAEFSSFSENDPVYNNYSEITSSLQIGLYVNAGSISAGLHNEWFREDANFSVDYSETGFVLEGDLFITGLILSSFESILGKRDFERSSDLNTDYTFERINLFSDLSLTSNMHLTILVSAEWEWHDLKSNNSNMYLLSTNLNYKIK